MTEDGVAEIARHILLQRRTELAGEPEEHVLHGDEGNDRDDEHLQRAERVAGNDERADESRLELAQPARRKAHGRLLEDLTQEWNEEREREDVERRGDDVEHDVAEHPRAIRPQERVQSPPLVEPSRHPTTVAE